MARAVLRPFAQLCCGLTVSLRKTAGEAGAPERMLTLESVERSCTRRLMRFTVRYYYVLFFAWIGLYVSLAGAAAAWAFTRADNTPFSAQTSYDWNIATAPESMANDATNAAFQSVESAQVTARSQVRCCLSTRARPLRRSGPPRGAHRAMGVCSWRAPRSSAMPPRIVDRIPRAALA